MVITSYASAYLTILMFFLGIILAVSSNLLIQISFLKYPKAIKKKLNTLFIVSLTSVILIMFFTLFLLIYVGVRMFGK